MLPNNLSGSYKIFKNLQKYKFNVIELFAGCGCRAFSHAGERKGFLDTRGTLFFDVPQKREQVIIGTRKDLNIQPIFPRENNYIITLKEAFEANSQDVARVGGS